MRREDIPAELERVSFCFFYWFSRFEFALKESGFLCCSQRSVNKHGECPVQPDWCKFVEQHKERYETTKEASCLIELHPKRQIATSDGSLVWRPVGIDDCNTDLCRVVRMLKTVRNNLFHGSKHGDESIVAYERNKELLVKCTTVLHQLEKLGGLNEHFHGCG